MIDIAILRANPEAVKENMIECGIQMLLKRTNNIKKAREAQVQFLVIFLICFSQYQLPYIY